MQSSEFEDNLIQLRICASCLIKKVMSGKYYNIVIHVHECMLQALERLFIEKYEDPDGSYFIGESKDVLKVLSNLLSIETLKKATKL